MRPVGVSVGVAPLPSVPLIPAAEDHQERPPKGAVQKGVQEGVQPRVNVPEPQPGRPQLPGHGVMDERVHHVGDEERRPAQAETAHYDRQRLCRLRLDAHAAVGYGSLLRGRGAHRCPEAVVLQWIRGSGRPDNDDGSGPGDGGGAGPLESLDLPHVGHGGDVDALVGQDHEA